MRLPGSRHGRRRAAQGSAGPDSSSLRPHPPGPRRGRAAAAGRRSPARGPRRPGPRGARRPARHPRARGRRRHRGHAAHRGRVVRPDPARRWRARCRPTRSWTRSSRSWGPAPGADHVAVVRRRPETHNLEAILSSTRPGAPASRTSLPLRELEDPAEERCAREPRDRRVARSPADGRADRARPGGRPAARAARHLRGAAASPACGSATARRAWHRRPEPRRLDGGRRDAGPERDAGTALRRASHATPPRRRRPADRRPDRERVCGRLRAAQPAGGAAPRRRPRRGRDHPLAADQRRRGPRAPTASSRRRPSRRRRRSRGSTRCARPRRGRPRTR